MTIVYFGIVSALQTDFSSERPCRLLKKLVDSTDIETREIVQKGK